MSARELAAALVELVLPRQCAGCGRSGASLCDDCRPAGPHLTTRVAGLPVVAVSAYDGPIRAALLDYKERGRRDLAGPLAALLAESAGAVAASGDVVLVPVPSTPRVARERGGDHLQRLAGLAGRRFGYDVADALVQARPVLDSAGLGAAERTANLHGAMLARRPQRPGVPALVVDDIATSGATLREAVRALRAAGWRVRGAAVVAATMGRRWQ